MSKEEKKKSRKKLWQWIISIIFIVGSIGILSDSFFAGVFSFVAGAIICPPITKIIKEKSEGKAKNWMFITAFIVLVLFSGMALPNSETSQQINAGASQQTNNIPKIIENSRNNPSQINIPNNFNMEYGWWQEAETDITITEVKRGESAWNMIEEANFLNDKPSEGKEYILTKIKIKVIKTEDGEPYKISTSDFKLVSSNGVVYEDPYIVEPTPKLDGEVYGGGVIEGWIAFEVDKSDSEPLLRIEGANDKELWIKISVSPNNPESNQEQTQQECVPNWKCGEWTICSNEIQTRTCTDKNDCGTNEGRPVETQNCKDYDLEMSISELLDEFSGLTKLQQEEKIEELKGKRIKTSTTAYKIDKASLSTQYVVMDDDYLYPSVKAFFPAEEKDKLLKVNIGDEITFIGEFVTYKQGTYVPSYVEFTKSRLID